MWSATCGGDGDGYRVARAVGGATTAFTWDRLGAGGPGAVIGDGASDYLFGPAGPQGRVLGGAARWARRDGLGSVRLVSDADGGVAGAGTYEAWGAPTGGSTWLAGFGFAGEPQGVARRARTTGQCRPRGRNMFLYWAPSLHAPRSRNANRQRSRTVREA